MPTHGPEVIATNPPEQLPGLISETHEGFSVDSLIDSDVHAALPGQIGNLALGQEQHRADGLIYSTVTYPERPVPEALRTGQPEPDFVPGRPISMPTFEGYYQTHLNEVPARSIPYVGMAREHNWVDQDKPDILTLKKAHRVMDPLPERVDEATPSPRRTIQSAIRGLMYVAVTVEGSVRSVVNNASEAIVQPIANAARREGNLLRIRVRDQVEAAQRYVRSEMSHFDEPDTATREELQRLVAAGKFETVELNHTTLDRALAVASIGAHALRYVMQNAMGARTADTQANEIRQAWTTNREGVMATGSSFITGLGRYASSLIHRTGRAAETLLQNTADTASAGWNAAWQDALIVVRPHRIPNALRNLPGVGRFLPRMTPRMPILPNLGAIRNPAQLEWNLHAPERAAAARDQREVDTHASEMTARFGEFAASLGHAAGAVVGATVEELGRQTGLDRVADWIVNVARRPAVDRASTLAALGYAQEAAHDERVASGRRYVTAAILEGLHNPAYQVTDLNMSPETYRQAMFAAEQIRARLHTGTGRHLVERLETEHDSNIQLAIANTLVHAGLLENNAHTATLTVDTLLGGTLDALVAYDSAPHDVKRLYRAIQPNPDAGRNRYEFDIREVGSTDLPEVFSVVDQNLSERAALRRARQFTTGYDEANGQQYEIVGARNLGPVPQYDTFELTDAEVGVLLMNGESLFEIAADGSMRPILAPANLASATDESGAALNTEPAFRGQPSRPSLDELMQSWNEARANGTGRILGEDADDGFGLPPEIADRPTLATAAFRAPELATTVPQTPVVAGQSFSEHEPGISSSRSTAQIVTASNKGDVWDTDSLPLRGLSTPLPESLADAAISGLSASGTRNQSPSNPVIAAESGIAAAQLPSGSTPADPFESAPNVSNRPLGEPIVTREAEIRRALVGKANITLDRGIHPIDVMVDRYAHEYPAASGQATDVIELAHQVSESLRNSEPEAYAQADAFAQNRARVLLAQTQPNGNQQAWWPYALGNESVQTTRNRGHWVSQLGDVALKANHRLDDMRLGFDPLMEASTRMYQTEVAERSAMIDAQQNLDVEHMLVDAFLHANVQPNEVELATMVARQVIDEMARFERSSHRAETTRQQLDLPVAGSEYMPRLTQQLDIEASDGSNDAEKTNDSLKTPVAEPPATPTSLPLPSILQSDEWRPEALAARQSTVSASSHAHLQPRAKRTLMNGATASSGRHQIPRATPGSDSAYQLPLRTSQTAYSAKPTDAQVPYPRASDASSGNPDPFEIPRKVDPYDEEDWLR